MRYRAVALTDAHIIPRPLYHFDLHFGMHVKVYRGSDAQPFWVPRFTVDYVEAVISAVPRDHRGPNGIVDEIYDWLERAVFEAATLYIITHAADLEKPRSIALYQVDLGCRIERPGIPPADHLPLNERTFDLVTGFKESGSTC